VYDDADGLKALNARLIKVNACDRRGRIALTLKQSINLSGKDCAFHAVQIGQTLASADGKQPAVSHPVAVSMAAKFL